MTEPVETELGESTTEPSPSSEGETAPQGWFWADGVPGEGPRPEFLPEKFKTVADAAKARGDLESKLGAFTGAPENYETEHFGLEAEQHTFKELANLGKELNMSQSGFDKLIGKLMSSQEAESSVSLQAEVDKLGEDGVRIMKQYENFRDNHLKGEEAELVKGWIQSADDLKVFNDLVKGIYARRLPTDNSMYMGNNYEDTDTIKAEMVKNLERYKSDETYRKDVRNRLDWADKRAKRG